MNTLPIPRQTQSKRTRCSPRPGTWWRALLLAVTVMMNLACVTVGVSFRVIHQKDQEDRVSITLSRQVTDEYLEAARRANAEREADYRAAGREVPASGFPDTIEEAKILLMSDLETLQDQGYQVVEDARGFTATADHTLAEFLGKQDESGGGRLQVDRDRPEGIYYIIEIDLPEIPFSAEGLDQLREEELGPKPPLEPMDEDTMEAGSLMGVIAAVIEVFGVQPTQLELWYAQRILIEAGFPENRYVVELPGEIVVHEVDGRSAGQVERNRVTLVMDEAFLREFGPGVHRFHVESLLSVCQETCSEHPHMIWDGVSAYPECTCICEKGWEMTEEGCVACQAICQQQDPPAEYDPENSENNECACRLPPDRDGDGIPDDEDACPDQHAKTQDGCPEEGAAVAPPGTEDEEGTPSPTTSDLVRNLEEFLAGQGVKGPSAGQAAAGAAAVSALLAAWVLTNLGAGVSREDLQAAISQWRSKPSEPPGRPHMLPSADPQSLQALERRFQETVDQKIREGYFVMNPDGLRKTWNWTIGYVINWAQGLQGGQCGDFAEWGQTWSRDFVEEIFGPGAVVDMIYVGEISTRYPDGFIAAADHLVYEANHAATRVILPTGERYVLDYWDAVGERQSDPTGDYVHDKFFGGPRPRRQVRLIPEEEWIEKWTNAIGKDDAEAHNLHYAQEQFQRYMRICDTFEEACELFRNDRLRGVPAHQIETIINSWRKSAW